MKQLSAVLATKCEFLNQAGNQQGRGAISHTKNRNIIALHRWEESDSLPVSQTEAPLPNRQAEVGRQGSLRQAIVYACNNKRSEMRVKVKETDPVWSQN